MDKPEREPFRPNQRSVPLVYKEHHINHCPGCGRTHWIIGRITAECAFCSTAIPLENSNVVHAAIIWKRRG